jgi:hypothetical protein
MYYLTFLIFIIIILFVYGILFIMKNKQVINTMEEFQNIAEDEEMNRPKLNLNNQQVIKYANGQWTTNDTTFIGNEPSNLLTIQVNDNEKGVFKINEINYTIKNIQNGSIYSNTINGRSYQIFFENFSDDTLSKNSNIVNIPHNQPRGTLFTNDVNEIIPSIMTFKVPLTEEAKLIIKNNFTQPNQEGFLFDKELYEIITKKYKYSPDALMINGNETMSIPKNKLNILKKKYNGSYIFQLQHVFTFPNNQEVASKISPLYEFKVLENKNENELPKFLEFKSLESEFAENKLLGKFSNVKTHIYFYKANNFSGTYDYLKPDITINKNQLKLKNNASSSFNNTLTAPDFKSVAFIRNTDFKPIIFDTLTSKVSSSNINSENNNENPTKIKLTMINRFLV